MPMSRSGRLSCNPWTEARASSALAAAPSMLSVSALIVVSGMIAFLVMNFHRSKNLVKMKRVKIWGKITRFEFFKKSREK